MSVFFLLIGFSFALFSCNGEAEKAKTDSTTSCKAKSLNPNSDSELAILMREFVAYTDSVKSDLQHNREPRPKPENLSGILTAKKTDANLDNSVFIPFAQSYIANVENFYNVEKSERVNAYNGMVNMCITCHQHFCGGPIKRIEKLYMK
jgi:hypothetical protein